MVINSEHYTVWTPCLSARRDDSAKSCELIQFSSTAQLCVLACRMVRFSYLDLPCGSRIYRFFVYQLPGK